LEPWALTDGCVADWPMLVVLDVSMDMVISFTR
jgi:hypothetical protein